ncbi:hypothetical protein Bca52824_022839 [Brassica carinata]|uniref:PHD finger protein ALFIN-LIKE n=1 Tax=Brassica carinata TaxID=52824 RepID=A0A8X7VHG3_BRACI|nr:hypothetical protein Bca52824_022839 [Brassica carinata]
MEGRGGARYNPETEEVFRDFKGRRAGILRALTKKDNLCLYGFPNEVWEVNLPAEEVPPELPEPALGINFARDGMQEKNGFLSLLSTVMPGCFLYPFTSVQDLVSIKLTVVTGSAKKQTEEQPSSVNKNSNRSKSNSKVVVNVFFDLEMQRCRRQKLKDNRDNYASDFWICCDMCEKWFHGKCVKITPARAEHIKQYKCPSCSNKRARP